MRVRSPICTVMGHVDHGKSSILDTIRGTCITATESGAITQAIGASIIPLSVIQKKCGDLLKKMGTHFTIPGLLFIDTPGHAAFTNLRKRGGNLADIAIIVIDLNEGFMPQTEEAIDILIKYKTPFIIAANKIDLVNGWKTKEGNIIQSIESQNEQTKTYVETKIYSIVNKLFEKFKVESERYDRINDFTKQVAIVPLSAKTTEGIPELLMMITGLAQKYLEESLKINEHGYAKGTILEVKEEKGLGTTLDLIIFNGNLKVNDTIVIGGLDKPIVTKVKAMFEPLPLEEMRDKKSKFTPVKEVTAATGIKLSAKEIEHVVAGMPLVSCDPKDIEKVKTEIQQEVDEVIIHTDESGILIKADSLGSLEAMITILREKNIPIRKATIGDISRKDILDAESNFEKDPLSAVILGFNIKPSEEVFNMSKTVKVIVNDVIYRLVENYEQWLEAARKAQEYKKLDGTTKPCKFMILEGYVFRQNNPAVVGCEIMEGTARSGMSVMNTSGEQISEIKAMEAEKKTIHEAEVGKHLAISLTKITIGRQAKEGDILYSALNEDEFKKLKDLKDLLKSDEKQCLKEIADIMRKKNPLWGV